MSTRCQVEVKAKGLDWDEGSIMLYHHSDGYPEHMLECIRKGFEMIDAGWKAGRPGKMASYLCAADPGMFEPEAGFSFHGDIEYFYEIVGANSSMGSMNEEGRWEITVYSTTGKFWEKPSRKNMKKINTVILTRSAKRGK